MRCDIVEDEEPGSARAKLRATVEEHIPDQEERRWVEPRLAHLLGLEEGAAGDQENLFSAWRILFERLAEHWPTILVFEDMQWADESLLDFLEYLLEWSRSHPLFVLVLARPELVAKRPSWGAGKRNFASLYLEPLSQQAMGDLLTGLVPGLPDDLRARILERAEGVPLYAVETVRMLLDRGLLAQEGNVYTLTGPVETLEVPETLHALIAARLDSLTQEERRLVQDGSVLGKTFTKNGLTALTGLADADLEPLLVGLVRKEVLSIQADPRSPERGQYSLPPGHRQARRLRDGLEAGAQARSTWRPPSSCRRSGARRRTRSSRSSPRTTSTPTPRRRTTRTPRAFARLPARCSSGPRSARRRSGRPWRRGAPTSVRPS